MTSLENYIHMIGVTILEYCNRQRYNSNDPKFPQIPFTFLDIPDEDTLTAKERIEKIGEKQKELLDIIFHDASKAFSGSNRLTTLLFFAEHYIAFRKKLVTSTSYSERGWKDFESELISFIKNCALLYNNETINQTITYDKRLKPDGQKVRLLEGDQVVQVELKGLNCQGGFKSGMSSGDLGIYVKQRLSVGFDNPEQHVTELITAHRVLAQANDMHELKSFIALIEVLNTSTAKLRAELDVEKEKSTALEAKFETQQAEIEALKNTVTKQDRQLAVLTIIKRGPSFLMSSKAAEGEKVEGKPLNLT